MSDQKTPDPLKAVTWFVQCHHCGATETRSRLTFSGGLHCTRCDDITEMPQEVGYRNAIDAALAALQTQHQQEIERLNWNLDVTMRERDDVQRQFDSACALLDARDETIRHLAEQIAALTAERDNQYQQAVESTQRALLAEAESATLRAERDKAIDENIRLMNAETEALRAALAAAEAARDEWRRSVIESQQLRGRVVDDR